MTFAVVLLVCFGLWNLFLPRSLMHAGGRWQDKNRRDAEPSDAYVVAVRAGGVVFLLLAVVVVVASVSKSAADAREDRLEAAWDTTLGHSSGSLDDRLVVVDGVPVTGPATSPDVVVPDGTTKALRYAVVGSDEEQLDPGLVSPEAADGDLMVRIDSRLCAPSRLVVAESGDAVRLTVVVSPTETWHTLQRSVPQFDEEEEPYCGDLRFPSIVPSTGLTVVHVPLDRPLRDRTVIDTTTGTVVPEVVETF